MRIIRATVILTMARADCIRCNQADDTCNKCWEQAMFTVLFEVQMKPGRRDTYLGIARTLKPELERVDGFIDNIRYASLTRPGWLLSLSSWRDEKALIRWRTHARHHEAQAKGRRSVLQDYHLRVGQVTRDTQLPTGHEIHEQRLDETETGAGTTATVIDAHRPAQWVETTQPQDIATALGLPAGAPGLVSWDVFDGVLKSGDVVLLLSWRDQNAAEAFRRNAALPADARYRQIRIIRDYGMHERREAPQYYPSVADTR